ncbi:MAG: TonB-dependent receptor plug domain-containing protein [Opitutaceae bacterium]
MKPNRSIPSYLRPLLIAPACALLAVSTLLAQQAAPPAATPAATTSEEVVKLSPFTVNTTKDVGYFAENTLAGSRINTNIGDLAASITVVTKQQMEDTASTNINDIFRYEASTEGSRTYSPSIVDRNTVKDSIAGYSYGNNGATTTNAQSNRIRGLNAPDAAINNYTTNNRIPLDEYNISSVEISRGPNSLLFGLGTPAGVVNANYLQAALNRDTNSVTLRIDQNSSYRTDIEINRSLIPDKLAIVGALLYDNEQFERKPSRDLYRRQYAALTYKPFKNTTIRVNVENYQNDANRPNYFTPRDQVTPWLQAGKPQYDPVTRSITIPGSINVPAGVVLGSLAGITPYLPTGSGQVLGPYVSNTLSPGYTFALNKVLGSSGISTLTSPLYVPGIAGDQVGNPVRLIENGASVAYFQRQPAFYAPVWTNPATVAPSATSLGWGANDSHFLTYDRLWTASANWPAPTPLINGSNTTLVNGVTTLNNYGSWNYPGVTNKSIYNWTKYNTLQTNWARIHASNYNIDFEQQVTDKLYFTAGWFRQDIDEIDNYTLNQLQGATLGVDTNVNNMDGTKNPYFGLPFIYEGMGGGIDTFFNPQTDDNYRAMLVYDLDYTQNHNWTKWLGRHRLIGTYQEQDSAQAIERWRNGISSADFDGELRFVRNPLVINLPTWSMTNLYRHYYMANPGDPQATVTHSIGFYGNQGWQGPVTSKIEVWNYASNTFQNDAVTEQIAYADNGSYRTQREVKGDQFAMQNYLWADRLISTFGWRYDSYRARVTSSGALTDIKGNVTSPALTPDQLYLNGYTGLINHDLVMSRWGRWDRLSGSTRTLSGTFRPLKDWKFVRELGAGSVVSEFLDGLSFYYNESNNFNPPATYQTDYFFKPLPKPTGKEKDIGFGFNLFDNKLVVRLNWYKTQNANERTTAAATLLTRLAYSDTSTGMYWAATVERIHLAEAAGKTLNPSTSDPNSIFSNPQWNTDNVWSTTSVAEQTKLWNMLGLPYNYYSGLSLGATQQSTSKGTELQITYNPTRQWTMKISGSKDQASYTQVCPEYDAWLAVRMPVWTSLTSDIPDFIDPNGSRAYSLKNFWTGYGFTSVALHENTNLDTSPSGYFYDVVNSQVATAKALEGAVSPDQRIYHASFLTNYSFDHGWLRGWSVGGAESYESKAAIGYLGKIGNPVGSPNSISIADITKPIWGDNGNYYTDLWIGYKCKIYSGKVVMTLQLNCNDALESGRLVATQANFDGSPWAFRIIDPRQWILTARFAF